MIDQKVDIAGGWIGGPGGDLVQQTAAGHETARIAHQDQQQGPLAAGELNCAPLAMSEHARRIKFEVSKIEHCILSPYATGIIANPETGQVDAVRARGFTLSGR